MAITSQEQHTLIQLVIGMFGIAPGYTYLPVVTKGYEDLGHSLPDAATALAALPQFKDRFPADMSATAFASTFLGFMGLQSDALAQRLVTDMFKAGVAPEQIILQAVLALAGTEAPEYAGARTLLDNRTELAYFHAQILGRTDTDFTVLRKVLETVTENPASVDAAKNLLNPPPPAPEPDPAPAPPPPPPAPPTVFTTGADHFTTTDGSLVYTATLGTGATLTANDYLHGNGNTLNITDTTGAIPDQWPTGLDLVGLSTISLTTAGNAGSSSVPLNPGFTGTTVFNLQSSGTGTDYLSGGMLNLTINSQASAISVLNGFGSLDITANHLIGSTALVLAGTGGAVTLHSPTGASSLNIATDALTLTGGFTDADNRLTSLTISAPGSLSKIDAVNASALTSLTVTGNTLLGSSGSRFVLGDNVTTLDLTGVTALASDGTSYLRLSGSGMTGDYKLGGRNVQLDMANGHGNAVITVATDANYTGTAPHQVLLNVPSTVQIDMLGEADLMQATSSVTNIPALLAFAAANPGKAVWKTISVNTYLAESATGVLGANDTTLIAIVGTHTPTYDAFNQNIIVG